MNTERETWPSDARECPHCAGVSCPQETRTVCSCDHEPCQRNCYYWLSGFHTLMKPFAYLGRMPRKCDQLIELNYKCCCCGREFHD